MRTHSLPLQILLILALVLNGIGGAMAGVLTALPAFPGQVPAVVATPEAPDSNDHCGEHEADPGPAAADLRQPGADCHSDGDTACGNSAECRQACMHASVAVPPLLSSDTFQAHALAILHPLASGHPAPTLRSPIRPPIA